MSALSDFFWRIEMQELTLEQAEEVAGGLGPTAAAIAGFAGGALFGAALADAALYGACWLLK